MSPADEAPDRERLRDDDIAGVFRTLESGVGGRFVRIGPALDAILAAHDLSEPAARALGEMLALAALLGADMSAGGQLIVQSQTDGVVPVIVADVSANGDLRGYAQDNVATAQQQPDEAGARKGHGQTTRVSSSDVVGAGKIAITLRADDQTPPYQSVVALDAGDVIDQAVARYFADREGVATLLRLAVSRVVTRGADGVPTTSWRAGGLLLQKADDAQDEDGSEAHDRLWDSARLLAETVEDHELVDPGLTTDRLLLRLFHEEGVQVLHVGDIQSVCRCSRERLGMVLKSFAGQALDDMKEADGTIEVRCEFCAKQYRFAPEELERT